MKVIDSHCHLGVSKLFGLTITEANLLRTMDTHGVDMALVIRDAEDAEKNQYTLLFNNTQEGDYPFL